MDRNPPSRAHWRTGEGPPRPKRPAVRILKIVPQVTHQVVILSRQLTQVWTHYVGRTRACTGPDGECWIDHKTTSCRWQGWLCVQRVGIFEQRLMWVTPTAVDTEPRLIDPAINLRGFTLEVGRVTETMNGPVWAKLGEDGDSARIAPDTNVLQQLERMFNAPPRAARVGEIKALLAAEKAARPKGGAK